MFDRKDIEDIFRNAGNSLNVGKIQLKTIVENYPYKNSIYSENYNEIINFIDSSLT